MRFTEQFFLSQAPSVFEQDGFPKPVSHSWCNTLLSPSHPINLLTFHPIVFELEFYKQRVMGYAACTCAEKIRAIHMSAVVLAIPFSYSV